MRVYILAWLCSMAAIGSRSSMNVALCPPPLPLHRGASAVVALTKQRRHATYFMDADDAWGDANVWPPTRFPQRRGLGLQCGRLLPV